MQQAIDLCLLTSTLVELFAVGATYGPILSSASKQHAASLILHTMLGMGQPKDLGEVHKPKRSSVHHITKTYHQSI